MKLAEAEIPNLKRAGFTQCEIADLCGVSQPTVCRRLIQAGVVSVSQSINARTNCELIEVGSFDPRAGSLRLY